MSKIESILNNITIIINKLNTIKNITSLLQTAPTSTPTVTPNATPTVTPNSTPTVTPNSTPTVTPNATPMVISETKIVKKILTADDCSAPEGKILNWVKKHTDPYGIIVTNFTKSWADGLAFCVLADKFTNAKIFAKCETLSELERHQLAYNTLEQIGINKLLDAEDTVLVQDSKSIQTYVMAIHKALCLTTSGGNRHILNSD